MEWIIPSDYDHVEAEAKHLIHAADANQVCAINSLNSTGTYSYQDE